jgi:L-lactate dehydrogenase
LSEPAQSAPAQSARRARWQSSKRGAAREVVLVDRTRQRARAVATDLRYGTPLSPVVDVRDGDFDDLAGSALIMVTAGINEKAGVPSTGATPRAG